MPESNALLSYVRKSIDTSTGGYIFKTRDQKLSSAIDTSTGGYIVKTRDQNLSSALDTITNNIKIIDAVHGEIHDGKHYVCPIELTATNDTDFINVFFLGQGSTRPKRHIVVEVSANQAGSVRLYEDILTSGAGGATRTILNNDRGSTNASAHKIETMGTTHSSSTGTLLWGQTFGANQPPTRVGGSAAQRMEFILESSLDYMLRYDPSAGAATVFINPGWYEGG